MTVLVVLLVLLLTESTISQSNYNNTNISNHCRGTAPTPNFIKNRNSTFDEIRQKLLNNRVLYARAKDISGGDSVYAAAQCRNYLSIDQCVACFDVGVYEMVKCTTGNGAYVFLDECYVRYETFDDFYNLPNSTSDGASTQLSSCGNESASQSLTSYTQSVDEFLQDIRDATPKTSDLYVANIRQIASENASVYAIAQCAEKINPAICEICMSTAYSKLKECLPRTEGRFFDMDCFARYSETPFFNANQTIDITNILKGRHSSTKVATIAGAIGGVVLFFLILVTLLLYRLRKSSKKTDEEDLKGTLNYNYKDLQLATNNFSEDNILGRGGYGEVFKAIIDDTNVVAVKRLQIQDAKAKKEFENEVKLISNVHHRNLLRLLGWSSEGSDLLLVLEYMANGSLDRYLWGAKRGTLNWNQRYEIITGTAKGLAHLHNEFHIKIVHRDIKSSNILLSDDFKAKIADFGLARLQPEDETHVSTNFAGTLGYAAPEYAVRGALSDKVDTYSFGIVILEIISGRRCTDINSDRPSMEYLLEHQISNMEDNNDGFFCSQPAPKSARITESLWRRVRRPATVDVPGSSSKPASEDQQQNLMENAPMPAAVDVPASSSNPPCEDQQENPVENPPTRKWSGDAIEFYNNGDAPVCYSRYIEKPLDRNFWGALLGFECNGSLSSIHVEAWTLRLMRFRQGQLSLHPEEQYRWTVLPPNFYYDMQDEKKVAAMELAPRNDPYPPLWEVDYVYLPLWIYNSDWLLVRIDMRTMVITQYWTDKRWRNEKRRDSKYYMELLPLFFGWYLDAIRYWRKSSHYVKTELSVGLVEVDVPQDNGNEANAGVLVCLMMEHLVRNKSLILEGDVEEICLKYRRKMAHNLYKLRCM